MTDKNTPEPTDAERRLARDWAEHIESNTAMPLMTGIPQATVMRQAMWRRNLDLADEIIRMGLI